MKKVLLFILNMVQISMMNIDMVKHQILNIKNTYMVKRKTNINKTRKYYLGYYRMKKKVKMKKRYKKMVIQTKNPILILNDFI